MGIKYTEQRDFLLLNLRYNFELLTVLLILLETTVKFVSEILIKPQNGCFCGFNSEAGYEFK